MELPRGTVYGVGRNYREHARELGNPVPEEPMIFLKAATSLCGSGEWRIPSGLGRIDFETELVVAVGTAGRDVPVERAVSLISAVAIGVDFTARDAQSRAKREGAPWARAKAFRGSGPVGSWVAPWEELWTEGAGFSLTVNGELRQQGHTRDMIFSVAELLSHISRVHSLAPGDVVFTGTPAGVGPVQAGDRLVAELAGGLSRLELTLVSGEAG